MESVSSVEVKADHDRLTWLVLYAASMHRRFFDGSMFPLWHRSVSECGGCLCSHPTAVSALWIHDLNNGRYFGPMGGSNAVLIRTASGVLKARTSKQMPPGERWTGSLLDEALGSELTPNAVEDVAVE